MIKEAITTKDFENTNGIMNMVIENNNCLLPKSFYYNYMINTEIIEKFLRNSNWKALKDYSERNYVETARFFIQNYLLYIKELE